MPSKKKILVTGGAGFIGSHLVDRLIKKGHKVIVTDNLSTGKKENLNKKAKFYKVDICSPKIAEIFKKEKPEAVFHYAAQIDVRKSTENPMEDAKINILGALNLLENCKKYKVKKFIFASSVGVYGEPKTLPVKENHPLNPIAPYPVTKVAVEKYLNYFQSQGLNFVSLRYSNIYGPRQSSGGEGGVVAIFINKILKGERPIIFGSGLQTRDFLFTADAVEAAILSLKAPTGSIYNVSTNKEITVKALLKLISNILNKKLQPIFKPLQQGEIIKSRIDYSKIKKELGWQPKYNLEKGLKAL
ncbi:unnamed protein product [marine sediment metagenome]|uniref:NAD-dependent epimerase/dehydratase domain-containing protein n=1 Tax=marine sediment metagenome TaxID=412755 RepID=X1KIP2_9ZZZZ